MTSSGPWDVILASTSPLPEPDPCERPLLQALGRRGLRCASWSWRDESFDWGTAGVVVLRATWDYPQRSAQFTAWLERVHAVTQLLNPFSTVRWNLHKGYLLELEAAGLPIVPTVLCKVGQPSDLVRRAQTRGWTELVVKPAIGAGSWETYRCTPTEDAERRADDALRERDVLIQPFVSSVFDEPERSLVFIGGRFTHAMHKRPRYQGANEVVTGPHAVSQREVELALRALSCAPETPLYGRVDLFCDEKGQPMISELELIEPSLFLSNSSTACDLLADHLADHVRRRPR